MATFTKTPDLWPFPWKESFGAYETDGPKTATAVHFPGATYTVEPTGDSGSNTGRDKFRVECLTCNELLHHNTTGPSSRIKSHHRNKHGGAGL